MATSLFRTAPTVRAALRAGSVKPRVASLAGTSFVRGKATLPDLSCKRPVSMRKFFSFGGVSRNYN